MTFVQAISAILFATGAAAAHAQTWVSVETTTTVAVRAQTARKGTVKFPEKSYLKAALSLPPGSKLRYVPANSTTARYLYDTSSGALSYSQLGWVRTILVDSIPGNPLSASQLQALNKKALFISSSLAGTFNRVDGGDPGGVIPPKGNYDTTKCFNALVSAGVPKTPLKNLVNFYNGNLAEIPEKRYLALSDYSGTSREERFYMIDLANCSMQKEIVAHGSGKFKSGGVTKAWGDPEHDGMLNRCIYGGNRQNMTRPGFAIIKGLHHSGQDWPVVDSSGAKGLKLYELGRAKDEGFNLAARGVVMHEQYYVANPTPGRSYGCPAMKPGHLKPKVAILKQGVLYYSYAPQCGDY